MVFEEFIDVVKFMLVLIGLYVWFGGVVVGELVIEELMLDVSNM